MGDGVRHVLPGVCGEQALVEVQALLSLAQTPLPGRPAAQSETHGNGVRAAAESTRGNFIELSHPLHDLIAIAGREAQRRICICGDLFIVCRHAVDHEDSMFIHKA
ncbi:hypothetical protein [Thioalkalivibrio sulfidiphilus]|uniref:hypothetical protein n=1 Tax=Thioalkalivibrio sulfidiphilus TaxID=1033854 RepID=UPI003B32D253